MCKQKMKAMQDPLYRELILDHWKNPHNYGILDNPSFDTSKNNPLCGDNIRLTGKIENGKLTKIQFVSEGCAISKASASIFTDQIKGKEIEEIKKIKSEEVIGNLGIMLTPAREKCALLIYTTIIASL